MPTFVMIQFKVLYLYLYLLSIERIQIRRYVDVNLHQQVIVFMI